MTDATRQSAAPPQPRRAWTFLAWTFGTGWGLALLMRLAFGPAPPATEGEVVEAAQGLRGAWAALGLLMLLLPGIVTIILSRRDRVPLTRYGLPGRSPGAALWLAPLVALGLTALATLLPIAVGIGRIDLTGRGEVQRLGAEGKFVQALELKLGLEEQPAPLLRRIASGLLLGVTLGLLLALGTELGWRGLLATELGHLGPTWSALACGLIAAAWWAPMVSVTVAGGETDWPGAALRLASYALLGIVLSWARATTGSVLTPAALVATWAMLGGVPALAIGGGTHLQLEVARLAAVAIVAAALLIVAPRSRTDAPDATSTGARHGHC